MVTKKFKQSRLTKKSAELNRYLENQKAINLVLHHSLSSEALPEILERSLKTILSLPWLKLNQKGCVCLIDENTKELVLKASVGFNRDSHTLCPRAKKGHRLCKLSYAKGKAQLPLCIGPHDIMKLEDTAPHGCYNIPIKEETGRIIGVFTLDLSHGHTKTDSEVKFLDTISGVLAATIKRKQVEDKASSAQLELSQVIQAINDHSIVAITDAVGKIIYVNDKFCEVSGYMREEVIGQNHRMLNSGHHPKSFFREMYSSIIKGKTWHGEIMNRSKQGSLYWVKTSITPIVDMTGKISKFIAIRTNTTEHHKTQQELLELSLELHKAAYFDLLTGLPNRAQCQKDMAEFFEGGQVKDKFAMVQIDVDNFKRINDSLGHAAGDKLLKTISGRMMSLSCRLPNVSFYRWGGDEFIGLIRRNLDADVEATCAELGDIISTPIDWSGTKIRPTISAGIAYYPEDAADVNSLMIYADLALYKMKEKGRNGYHFFTKEMKQKLDSQVVIENELRHAIENDELILFFQPQVHIRDETITGIEALIRWDHPEKGILGPYHFMPIAESIDLASAIGKIVIEKSMKAVSRWTSDGLNFGRLAMNLSPGHIKRQTLLDDFFSSMSLYNVNPKFLSVEFLESFVIDDDDVNFLETLRNFRAQNIDVELDDFGTGYASLVHLTSLPISGFKIDRSFIERIHTHSRYKTIVRSLMSISSLLDLRVVCEGVEHFHQIEAISKINNCSIQGYFVAKPMGFDEMTNWIRKEKNIGSLYPQENFKKLSTA